MRKTASLSRDDYYELGLALEGGDKDDDNTAMKLVRAAGGDLNAIRNPDTGVPIFLDIQVVDDPVRLEWIIETFFPKLRHVEEALGYSGALVEKMRTRANRCYRVCLYFFELRKMRVLPLDMARVMAQMVWATRCQAEWDEK